MWPLFATLVFFIQVLPSNGCARDTDCNVPTERCFASICVECFDCEHLKRKNLTACPQNPVECGQCLAGYEEIQLTAALKNHKKPCKRSSRDKESISDSVCLEDADCHSGSYCFDHKVCVPCTDCSDFMRSSPSTDEFLCVTDVLMCGPCLPGFVDVPVTDGSRPKPCEAAIPVAIASRSILVEKKEFHLNLGAFGVFGGIVGLVVVALLAVYAIRSRRIPENPVENTIESCLPPPYTVSHLGGAQNQSETVSVSDAGTEEVGFLYKEPREEDSTARVYRLPTYEGRGPDVPPNEAPVDEETQACLWRPGTENSPDGELTFNGRIACHASNETITRVVHEQNEPSPKRMKTDS